jgi:dTDP-3,4-didehydro-2,6-dideoxy-alpha-D-glucose 3-reductase
MKTINIAVWGLGRHALVRILPAINTMSEIALIGVCSRNKKIVSDVASKQSCIGWTSSNEMLCDPNVDVIYISSPIGVHFNQAYDALKAGKNVWCEKPLTCSYEDSSRLVSLAQRNNKMLVEAFMFLYHPQFDKLRNYINDERYGHVHSLNCKFGIPSLENPGFRLDENLGGGAFWDIASYPFAAVTSLFESQDIKILFAEVIKEHNASIDTDGRALLKFASGTLAYLEWGMNLSYRNEIDVWSEKGSFFTDKIFSKPQDYKSKYFYRDLRGEENSEEGEISDQFINMFKVFYNIYFSSVLISKEYQSILKRGKLLDEILINSKFKE